MEHFRKLERMYHAANFNTQIYHTTSMNVSSGAASVSMDVTDKYFHALGAMHGSVYFKMLDDAAFFAVASVVEDVFPLTTSFNINFLKPVNSGRIKATGKLKFKSKSLFIAESNLIDADGNEVAFGTGNFAKSRVELTPEIGYC